MVGVFDGVHIGHKALFNLLKGEAEKRGLVSTALAFSNHPEEVLLGSPPPRLTTAEERRRLIEAEGVEVVEIPFTYEIASMGAVEFVEQVLQKWLGARLLVLGEEARIGKGREAGLKLRGALMPLGMEVLICPSVEVDSEPVSSSRIRSLLSEGEIERAMRFLGRPYEISGEVVLGEGRGGRELVPTCNIAVPSEKLLPRRGVYAAIGAVDGEEAPAVVNIGVRPTFGGGGKAVVEAHLIGLEPRGPLYGWRLLLRLLRRLREERRFPTVEELRRQIERDIQEVLSIVGSAAAQFEGR